ncbi:MAG: hypothetical protein ACEQSX_08075 [Baekduiaceae bacterium]
MSRRLLILGSTGSIGTQALDIVQRSDELELVGLSAERSWDLICCRNSFSRRCYGRNRY